MAYEYVDSAGLILPDTSELETEVEDEYKAVFGDDLDVNPETPEGILITAEVTQRAGLVSSNAQVANQINPNFAGGVFLGAIAALTQIPVIGLPLDVGPLRGVDALYAMAQLPPGCPVATVGIGNAKNAALLALRILGE